MVKKRSRPQAASQSVSDKPATLKDLLQPELVKQLTAQADAMKAQEQKEREAKRKAEEDARKAEKKRLENDFEYLLNNSSPDWGKSKY
ncbi:YqkE family protein [Paenibacillus sp. YYML68]|uniref:YqkE family protein n=1 Tax=Paenibacillus sp. YYML68 TaxID=2909250 RepID=UPI00248FF26A|nr:YqkE family protein [Paenibacillus sp. YYML68]